MRGQYTGLTVALKVASEGKSQNSSSCLSIEHCYTGLMPSKNLSISLVNSRLAYSLETCGSGSLLCMSDYSSLLEIENETITGVVGWWVN